jgi:hypothetical protein
MKGEIRGHNQKQPYKVLIINSFYGVRGIVKSLCSTLCMGTFEVWGQRSKSKSLHFAQKRDSVKVDML